MVKYSDLDYECGSVKAENFCRNLYLLIYIVIPFIKTYINGILPYVCINTVGVCMFAHSKKILIIVLLFCAGSVFAMPDMRDRGYFGVDYEYQAYKVDNDEELKLAGQQGFLKEDSFGINMRSGYRWDCLGIEGGLTVLRAYKYRFTNGSIDQNMHNWYLDLYYYYPLMKKIDFKAMVGVGAFYTKTEMRYSRSYTIGAYSFTANTIAEESSYKIAPRAGLGLQYNVSPRWSTNAMYKFQGKSRLYKNSHAINVGVAYYLY